MTFRELGTLCHILFNFPKALMVDIIPIMSRGHQGCVGILEIHFSE